MTENVMNMILSLPQKTLGMKDDMMMTTNIPTSESIHQQ
jgi:hypothetical protein